MTSPNHQTSPGLVRWLHRIEDGFLVVALLAMIALAFGQIILRNLFGTGFVWIDPLLRILVLWVGLLGALVATREGKHISVDVLTRILSPRIRLMSGSITVGFAALVSGIIAWHSTLFVIDEMHQQTMAFASIPAWLPELIIPVAFTIMAIRFAIRAMTSLLHLARGTNQ